MLFHDSQPQRNPSPRKASSGTGAMTQMSPARIQTLEDQFRFDGPTDSTVTVGGRHYINFAGDGYLGLQAHPEVMASACEAVLRYGVSVTASQRHFIPTPVLDVEHTTAHIFGTENAFYCDSKEELIALQLESLAGSFEHVFMDEGCSPTLIRFVARVLADIAPMTLVSHRDPERFREILMKKLQGKERPLFITEGVFTNTGTIAPIDQYMEILSGWEDSSLLIEDSYGFGVLGKTGRGTLEHFGYNLNELNQTKSDWAGQTMFTDDYGFSSDRDMMTESAPTSSSFRKTLATSRIRTGRRGLSVRTYWLASLSKALGGYGAVMPGSNLFVEQIRESAVRAGTGVPPTPIIAATAKCLELSFTDSATRKKLQRNVNYFKKGLRQLGFLIEDNPVPIVSIKPGSSMNMRRIQRKLSEKQFLVSYLPRQKNIGSQGALRMSIFATHNHQMLESFLKALVEAIL